MQITLRPASPVNVTGVIDQEGPRRVMDGETAVLEVEDDFSVTKLTDEELGKLPNAAPVTDDAFAETNRPNGPMTAAIAPKMPKPMGELEHRVEGGRIVERPVAERGRAEQAGGAESSDGRTPGPQPATEERGINQTASATGDVDDKGRPVARSTEATQTSAKDRASASKTAAKKSSAKRSRR